jgi:hypothetical protein
MQNAERRVELREKRGELNEDLGGGAAISN